MRWKDMHNLEGEWVGLELEVARGELPAKPRWRMEYAQPGRLRVVCGRGVQLWARVDGWWWEDWWVVLGERVAEGVLGPIRAEQVRAVRAAPRSEAWWSAWARRYAQGLRESPCTPLYPGGWRLTPVRPHVPPLEDTAGVTPRHWHLPSPREGAEASGALFNREARPLRPWSQPEEPRVKAWRKRAREGTLPPLLLFWSARLSLFFVLDGHDRLLAAQLEGVEPAALALWPFEVQRYEPDPQRQEAAWKSFEEALADPQRSKRISTRSLNTTLISLCQTEHLRSVQRVWKLPQGRVRWAREVRRRLVALGVDPDESEILYPLTHLPSGRPRRRRPGGSTAGA
jgi:hypothetical protein